MTAEKQTASEIRSRGALQGGAGGYAQASLVIYFSFLVDLATRSFNPNLKINENEIILNASQMLPRC